MQSMTSISGGKTSAYLAANYETDFYIFALVRTDDKNCIFKDRKLAQRVEDRIQKPFIGTLEDDIIINTIFDLEQYIQKPIIWVSGDTFDNLIKTKGDYLPNIMTRYCTTNLKIDPIFKYWQKNINKPVIMNIGYRATELKRAQVMNEKLNKNGLSEYKTPVKKDKNGRNVWRSIEWRKPNFPLINDFIERQDIEKYWRNKPVRFAALNNCIGCFHRSAALLKKMSELHPKKFEWFLNQEKRTGNKFKKNLTYEKVNNSNFTLSIPFDYDGEGCESGFCGL